MEAAIPRVVQIKCRWFSINPGLLGGGGICRNNNDAFIFGFSVAYGVGSNNLAELHAIHDGMVLCLEKGKLYGGWIYSPLLAPRSPGSLSIFLLSPRILGKIGVLSPLRQLSGYGTTSNNLAELRAVWDGLKFCISSGMDRVLLKSDSKWVVDCISGESSCDWKWVYWLARIKSLLDRGSYRISLIPREANGPVDGLTKEGSRTSSTVEKWTLVCKYGGSAPYLDPSLIVTIARGDCESLRSPHNTVSIRSTDIMENLRVFWSFILFHAVLLSSINSCSPSVFTLKNNTDQVALLAFKYGISEDPYRVLSSWNDSLHFCQWKGVTCSRRHHQRVTSLNLRDHSLLGHLSPHIGNLSFLRRIDLSNNKFQGQIPQEIDHLFRLQHLNLSVNSLQGEIPSNLSHCSELITIHIRQNQLVGELPADLGSLSKLIVLSVSKNDLRGSIPPSLGNLSSLTTLDLTYNNFEGQIPNQLGQLAGIIFFGLGVNQLSGTIPPSIYNLSSIQVFSVAVNRLHGRIPPNLGLAFPRLRWISLGGNQFTGPIPISLSNASSLENFDIVNNSFSGPVPENLGSLSSLYRFNIAINQLGSREGDDLSFLTSLTNCTRLQLLGAAINNLYGELPSSIANLSTQLNVLFLGGNKIFGIIPKGIENLISLYALDLSMNSLKGILPDAIGKLDKLQDLRMFRNKLSGPIPPLIGNITRLSFLYLDGNDFHGNIPSSFGNWGFMEQLFISENKLNGTIPKQISAAQMDLSRNSFTGSFLLEADNLENIREMNISENKLSGKIPGSLGKCQSLEFLYMNGNLFQGTIPESLRNLKVFEFVIQ
ncbi:LRR receptor-like serine/threonine-protein kinase EFR [Magnolia sinica]|uniref:LRR receptor-like serine/threonine-protein kinase EFR n=1 Tax=Magnolia sinica TaxID=86752 RepID=UPI00265A815F|nr:LRR receptor-like serine/threonine-protein kinase EFR [Magnolia sinica]